MSAGAEFRAVVVDVRLESRSGAVARWQMALDRTGFAAGAAGVLEAVAPSGARLEIPVIAVALDADGVVWHVVEKPLVAGTEVVGRVAAASAQR